MVLNPPREQCHAIGASGVCRFWRDQYAGVTRIPYDSLLMSRLEATQTRPTEPPATPPGRKSRLLVAWLGVLVLAATAVVGSNMFAVRDHLFGTATPNAAAPAVGRSAGAGAGDATQTTVAAAPTSLRSQPWWQD